MNKIPFNSPNLSGNEQKYIQQVFENKIFDGNGPFTKRVQDWLEKYFDAPKVLLTHSCTAGLEMAALISELRPGDEVLIPSFTFVTTASSMMRTGAIPVFCEINPETMSISLEDAKNKLTKNTKAIIPVHYAGNTSDIEEIVEFAKNNNLIIIEDAAQSLGTKWKGKPLGSFAPLSAVSFHATKNIHCGLGGCLIINDPSLVENAEIIWERGTDRSAFFKGLVDKYTWQELGSSFYPTEFQAAFLLAQLEEMDNNLNHRQKLWNAYYDGLHDLENQNILKIISPHPDCHQNAHMFAIILSSAEEASNLRAQLNKIDIQAVIHYVPLHDSPMGLKLGYSRNDLPITADASDRLLRLPLHSELNIGDISFICDKIIDILKT